jgi:hypothetical protein
VGRHVRPLLCVAAILVFGSTALSATRNVPSPEYPTIQSAIDASSNDDEVVVAPGTYLEQINFKGRLITVRSADPEDPGVVAATVLDGQNGEAAVRFDQGETAAAALSGFTIRKAFSGVWCSSSAGPSITHNVVRENGIGVHTGWGAPEISLNRIADNGFGVMGLGFSGSLTHNEITSNHGGGVLEPGSGLIAHNLIKGNTSARGGGICCTQGKPTIIHNVIVDNVACDGMAGEGGGIFCQGVSPVIAHNIIAGNKAGAFGGGIFCWYGASPTIESNTITHNGTMFAPYGTTIVCMRGAKPVIRNCIVAFAGDGVGIASDEALDVSYCDLYGNVRGNFLGFTPTGAGDISLDPLFADPANWDFHLKSRGGRWTRSAWVIEDVHSPCIDAGDPASDYATEPAPNGGRLNIGAYGNTPRASKSYVSPDVMIRNRNETAFLGDNLYTNNGVGQTKCQGVRNGIKAVYVIRVQNDGTRQDSYRVRGTPGATNWIVRYFVGSKEVTAQVCSAPGWSTGELAPAATRGLRAEVTPLVGVLGNQCRAISIRAISGVDHRLSDTVKAKTTCLPAYRPDGLIRLVGATTWLGSNVYNGTGASQTAEGDANLGEMVVFELLLQNDGNVREQLQVAGPAGGGNWCLRYYDAWAGGANRTSGVTGGGWQTPALNPGATQELRVEVVAKSPRLGASRTVPVRVRSTGNPTRQDTVHAVARAVADTSSAGQLSALTAVPTGRGAEVLLTLSGPAEVEARVLNVAGRPVRTLCTAKRCAAGTSALLWDALSDSGLPVPSGAYVIEAVARAPGGAQTRAVASVRLAR